jgi:predicted AAA+ superfamily ATPase
LTPKKIYSCDLGIKFLFHGDRDMGSYFENYVYLLLRKKKKLYYLLSDEVELDFFTQDKILVEAKYDTKLNAKQEKLFKEFKANKKFLIDSSFENFRIERNIKALSIRGFVKQDFLTEHTKKRVNRINTLWELCALCEKCFLCALESLRDLLFI